MAIQSRVNQYTGINAHLQSYFQNSGSGSWTGFHNTYISDLMRDIDANLPEGYEAISEKSLQIKTYHPDSGERLRYPQPDVSVYQRAAQSDPSPALSSMPMTPTLTLPFTETITLTDEAYYQALLVRDVSEGLPGKVVLRIELLSPGNKKGENRLLYDDKRITTVMSGVRLVELDFLHESKPFITRIPPYPQAENAFPYYIAVTNPAPKWQQGIVQIYGFAIDDPIPHLQLPLGNGHTVSVDFMSLYNRLFQSVQAFWRRVDYEQLPENFDQYSPADKARIERRMQLVQTKHAAGDNLETGAFPINDDA